MTDPETATSNPTLNPDERDVEAPDADALEQAEPADPLDAARQSPPEVSRDPEVSDWDALEQAQVVDLDDEEY